jgi:hypothetical protein
MTYNEACKVASNSIVTTREISSPHLRRNFVGIWTTSARVFTGSNVGEKGLYRLYQSNSDSIDYFTLTPSTFTINAGKIFTAGTSFVLGLKDTRLTVLEVPDFEFQLLQAEEWKVLLYRHEDKRAWLVDGLSALLHLSIAWLVERMPAQYVSTFRFGSLKTGRPDAKTVLLDNRTLPIYQRPESH